MMHHLDYILLVVGCALVWELFQKLTEIARHLAFIAAVLGGDKGYLWPALQSANSKLSGINEAVYKYRDLIETNTRPS